MYNFHSLLKIIIWQHIFHPTYIFLFSHWITIKFLSLNFVFGVVPFSSFFLKNETNFFISHHLWLIIKFYWTFVYMTVSKLCAKITYDVYGSTYHTFSNTQSSPISCLNIPRSKWQEIYHRDWNFIMEIFYKIWIINHNGFSFSLFFAVYIRLFSINNESRTKRLGRCWGQLHDVCGRFHDRLGYILHLHARL